jgi:hypothetical protein
MTYAGFGAAIAIVRSARTAAGEMLECGRPVIPNAAHDFPKLSRRMSL